MSQSEVRNCQNCKGDFTIDQTDSDFYEKIKVPPPTFCPHCRLQRRLAFRNERALYKRKCDLCQKDFIGQYPADASFPVYCAPCWWSDSWTGLDYGQEYDFSRPFFEQFFELQNKAPHMGVFTSSHTTMVNSDYTNLVGNLKNCYLIFNADYNEGCCYGTEIESSKDCFDNLMIEDCQLCHECVNCRKCYRTFYSVDCEASSDVWFSRNLSGCTNCFGCTNLRQKKHHFFNEALSEEEYKKRMDEISLTPQLIEKYIKRRDEQALKFPYKYAHTLQNKNVTGDYVYNSKNVLDSYIVTGGENCRYAMWGVVPAVKDSWDWTEWGNNAELQYECMGTGENARNCRFTRQSLNGVHDLEYCFYCVSSGNLFGCVSVKKGEYCILNKQYDRESFSKLRNEIIEQMNAMPFVDSKGRRYSYGEFPPVEHSQFAYNETNAMEHFLLSREDALDKGYRWRDAEAKGHRATIEPASLSAIKDAPDSITQEVVACKHVSSGGCIHACTAAFRVIPQEFQFYKSMNIPLPEFCPNCRHGERLKFRNPIGLYKRVCQCQGSGSENGIYQNTGMHAHGDRPCSNEFETPYALDRPEIVYCENCYQQEVS